MSISTLPSPRDFVTQLLISLSSLQPNGTGSIPLSEAPEPVKKKILSLQVLFPNEFLPALDLLDRRLITRFQIGVEESGATGNNATTTVTADAQMQDDHDPLNAAAVPESQQPPSPYYDTSAGSDVVHYVRSAQQRSSRFSTSCDSTTYYEVRLRAWNCTCPAFAFAAFPSTHPEPALPTYVPASTIGKPDFQDAEAPNGADKAEALGWIFGGVSLVEGMPPVCKHLLACVFAEECSGIFGACMEERKVSVETAAGWAAGWGDL